MDHASSHRSEGNPLTENGGSAGAAGAGDAQPRPGFVRCASPAGLHRLAYVEWGAQDNRHVVVCVHGLTRTGRDFDRLAQRLAARYRVVCPDMPGRGRSSWLPDASLYNVPQYLSDCLTLIARLNVERLAWVGTSMGGLIGMALAALPDTPIDRMVVNDVGPELGAAGLQRIASYAGKVMEFPDFEEGVRHVAAISSSFGPLSLEQWRELCQHLLVQRDGRWVLHYDPKIVEATRTLVKSGRPAPAAWPMWDAIRCPTLLLRGADSDLLEPQVAEQMTQRGPGAQRIDYAGVGHAPSLVDQAQIEDVAGFLDQAPTS